MPDSDVLIPVGKIIGAHGVKGNIKVYSYSDNLESLRAARTVTVKGQGDETREFGIKTVAGQGGKVILGLMEISDIDQVPPLVGSEICLYRSQLPKLEEDEYYWCDLIGLEVVTVDGEMLGSIAEIFETGGNDVYVVRGGKREYLIPAVASVIGSIDLAGGRMLVTPLEGLLDL